MNKKHFIIPNIIISVAIVLIILLIPVKIQNPLSFSIVFIMCLLTNILSSIVILKNNSEKLKNDIYNIPIIYVFVFFQFMLFILLIISKLVNINASILIITLIILLLIYCILFYFLVFSKKYIINKEDNLKCKTEYQKQWLIKLEILINSNSDKELYSLYEKVKYMDKVQSDATEEVDNKINSIFENIGDDITISQINELTKLIDKRNIINKNSK